MKLDLNIQVEIPLALLKIQNGLKMSFHEAYLLHTLYAIVKYF